MLKVLLQTKVATRRFSVSVKVAVRRKTHRITKTRNGARHLAQSLKVTLSLSFRKCLPMICFHSARPFNMLLIKAAPERQGIDKTS